VVSVYQQEVAEMDRRHHFRVRALSFVGAATLIIVAFWSAGLPPTEWYTRLHKWLSHESTTTTKPATAAVPKPVTPTSAAIPTVVKPLSGTDSSISPVPLPLYLIATSPGRNAHEGTARIGTSPENPQTYGAGATLANGAQLVEIRNDYVVLERDHKSVRLYMKSLGRSNTSLNDLLTVGGAEPPKPQTPTMREVLTDYVRPSPIYDGNVLRGFQVYPGPKSGIFSRLGLQAGDVITAINDAPLVDPATTLQSLNQVVGGTALVVTVERKQRRERVVLDGSLIAADVNSKN
jgi:hypothetical protein